MGELRKRIRARLAPRREAIDPPWPERTLSTLPVAVGVVTSGKQQQTLRREGSATRESRVDSAPKQHWLAPPGAEFLSITLPLLGGAIEKGTPEAEAQPRAGTARRTEHSNGTTGAAALTDRRDWIRRELTGLIYDNADAEKRDLFMPPSPERDASRTTGERIAP
jgi:hypothetical protein